MIITRWLLEPGYHYHSTKIFGTSMYPVPQLFCTPAVSSLSVILIETQLVPILATLFWCHLIMKAGIRSSEQNALWGGEEELEFLERNEVSQSVLLVSLLAVAKWQHFGMAEMAIAFHCIYYRLFLQRGWLFSPVTVETFQPSSPTSGEAAYYDGFPERLHSIMLPAVIGFAMFEWK